MDTARQSAGEYNIKEEIFFKLHHAKELFKPIL